ncbi:MAG: PqqD family protein [Elusimicrobiota bacterium]|nr:PqqD family protein [Elusimicrobiota bacterium]
MANKDTARYKYAAHAAWRVVDEETIVLDLNTSVYYSLNATASLVWKRLGDGETAPEIAQALTEAFDVAPEAARADVDELVSEMRKESLLVPA